MTRDLFLTSEERFEVWQVKMAERPQWIQVYQQATNEEDNDEDDQDNNLPLPLTDGCDLPTWRQGGLIDLPDDLQAVCHVGVGCPLLRRETQFPVLSSRHDTPWRTLQDKLSQPVLNAKNSVHCIDTRTDTSVHTVHPWWERRNVPVLLQHLADNWPAMHTYRWQALLQRFGDTAWRVSDTHAETLTLQTFTKYATTAEGGWIDDAPLALYDSQFHLDERACLVQDYTVPTCFAHDLYALIDQMNEEEQDNKEGNDHEDHESNDDESDKDDNTTTCSSSNSSSHHEERVSRPPFRWILMGGERSGTGLHVDPVGTHAWVTLIQGLKRWVLFPPHVNRTAIGMQEPQIPSALWFRDWYDKAVSLYANDVVHVLQQPGDTVYVPAGWPHIVLNLQPSVAVTENYATHYPSMTRLWEAVQEESPALYKALYRAVTKYRPDLALSWQQADEEEVLSKNAFSSIDGTQIVHEETSRDDEAIEEKKYDGTIAPL